MNSMSFVDVEFIFQLAENRPLGGSNTYVMFNDYFSEIQIIKIRVVSSTSGSGQSEVTKYISCIFEADFSSIVL